MNRMITLIILVIAVALLAMIIPAIAAVAADDDAKRQVAEKFIHAYLLKTEDIVPYVPANRENLFSPYPFKGPLQLSTPKVHGNQAILEFTGTVADSKFPRKGAILFYYHNVKWNIRQVLFFDQIPRYFGLPTKSVTEHDKSFEPEIKAMGQAFLIAWEKGELDKMLADWFNWPASKREPVKGLHMSNLKMKITSTTWGDSYVEYTVKLTYKWGIFSFSNTLRGGLLLVNEEGTWKVRGNQMVLDF